VSLIQRRRIFMDEEIGEIEMLADFDDALLGCVYAEDGTPVACYSSEVVMMRLAEEGYGEDEALVGLRGGDYHRDETDMDSSNRV
jgi:hypothetical protein